jgi:methylenetetrahydrofolate reductase (NADPH)
MDQGVVARYAQRLAADDTTRPLYLLIGVAPLRSAKSALWMKEHLYGTIIPDDVIERLERAADPAAEGARICVELVEALAATPGVAGVHIMAPANEAVVPEVIAQARQRLPKR